MTRKSDKGVLVAQWGLVVVVLGLLELGTRSGFIDRLTLVPFSNIWNALVAGIRSGRFGPHVVASLGVMLEAFLLAVVIGIPVGYGFSVKPRIYRLVRPYIESYYCLPVFVFYPVAIAMMGLSRWPALIIVWTWAVGGVIVNTVIGFNKVPAALEKYCRSVHLTEWQKLLHVRLPAASPSILTGIKLAVVYAISGTIGVEFILSSRGVGKLISIAFNDFRTAEMYALILMVVMFGAVCHLGLDHIETRLMRLQAYAVDHGASAPPDKRSRGDVGVLSGPGRFLMPGMVPLVAVLAWYGLSLAVGVDKLATPVGAVMAAKDDFLDGTLKSVFSGTLTETLISFVLSACVGLLLGLVLGRFPVIRKILGPWITAAYTVPKIVLFPILLFLFGLGTSSRIAYGFLHAAPAIMLFTIAGLMAVNPGHLKYARSLQLSGWKAFRHIVLPSAVPEILSGLRLGLGMCFLGVLVAEMLFGASEGAGFAVVQSSVAGDTSRLMAYVVSIFALVLLANYFMAFVTLRPDRALR